MVIPMKCDLFGIVEHRHVLGIQARIFIVVRNRRDEIIVSC